jgi:hypothetical protein
MGNAGDDDTGQAGHGNTSGKSRRGQGTPCPRPKVRQGARLAGRGIGEFAPKLRDCRNCILKTLRVTPAIAAGVTDWLWELAEIDMLVEAAEAKPGNHGPYKKLAD